MPNGIDIASGISSLKAAMDLAKALIGIRDESIIRERVIDLQDKIVAARESQLAALDQINALKKEVADLKAWDAEKEKYDLTNFRPPDSPHGKAFAYALKEEISTGKPTHLVCERCFEDRVKSTLQEETRDPGQILVLFCVRCGAELSRTGVWYSTTPRYGATKPPSRPRR